MFTCHYDLNVYVKRNERIVLTPLNIGLDMQNQKSLSSGTFVNIK